VEISNKTLSSQRERLPYASVQITDMTWPKTKLGLPQCKNGLVWSHCYVDMGTATFECQNMAIFQIMQFTPHFSLCITHQAILPIVHMSLCIRQSPHFYSDKLLLQRSVMYYHQHQLKKFSFS